MFESVAAFDGDSTITKILPLSAELSNNLAVDFFAVLAVFLTVLDLAASDFETDFFHAGIVITPIYKIFSCNFIAFF